MYFSLMAKALAHPARVAIVRMLLDRGKTDSSAIVDSLPLSKPTVSEHLRILREAGFVTGIENGRRVQYRVNKRALKIFGKGLRSVEKKQTGQLAGVKTTRGNPRSAEPWWEELVSLALSRPGPSAGAAALGRLG